MKEIFEALRERFDAQVDRFREGGALKELHDLKYRHCFRVSREAEGIASDLGWEADRVACARGLGLLHDLGRFEQYARHGTFNDRVSVDHGDLGETLVREHFVDLLPQTWLRVIPPAIRWHNKRRLPADLDPELLPFARLIRDADKVDVYRVIREHLEAGRIRQLIPRLTDLEGPPSEALVGVLLEEHTADYGMVRNLADLLLVQACWVYDMHFPPALRRLLDRRLLEGLRAWICPTPAVDRIFAEAADWAQKACA